MNLLELTLLSGQYNDRETGGKIPWNDPDFSRRMLENHLSQEHDWASRKLSVIEQQVDWIARQLPAAQQYLIWDAAPDFTLNVSRSADLIALASIFLRPLCSGRENRRRAQRWILIIRNRTSATTSLMARLISL
ncbi:DNA methyltransferase [Citrobacter amalonaticus]|nr:DNA methyltransferase [Citrobacter amalonaticus]